MPGTIARSISPNDTAVEDGGLDSPTTAQFAEMARTFSQEASHGVGEYPNPFLDPSPQLDPSSPSFDAKEWARCLLGSMAGDPEKYPRQSIGVSWRDLSVHGFGRDTDYQKDVLNVLWQAPMIARNWISARQDKIQILRNFDGLVNPGDMVLVLGRPGSGVSTLLKTIAGQVHGLHLSPETEFNYQGAPWGLMHSRFRGEIIYQAETDMHFPQLTVGQTLQFAALARTPANRLPGVSRELYARHLRDVVMAVFGISHTVNTKVGGEWVRGVSGGERKRVSIAEAALSMSSVQCWDNSTRGLDSATALEFCRVLKMSTELGGNAAIVAMYQASEPAYRVFDKVVVLYEGRQIYFGPRDDAKKYFTDMGYHCPDRQTTADFLTSLTDPSERLVTPGFEKQVPRTPDEFADAWKHSSARARLLEEISAFEADTMLNSDHISKLKISRKAQQAPLTRNKSPYTISIPMQIRLCMTRGFQRLGGDKLFTGITIAGMLIMSLVLGSIFYDLDVTADTLNSKCVLLYFAILFNGLSSALEIFSLYAQRPIVEKQYQYAWYHPFAEALASITCEMPNKIVSAIAFNIPLYFMANLRREPGPFFIFLLFSFVSTIMMSMLLRTIGQVSKTVQQALAPAAMLILGLVIYTGFVLPTQSMQGWLRWINYIDPIAYSYESLVVNEFSGRDYPCSAFVPAGLSYVNATATERVCSVAGALPGQGFVQGDLYINANYGYYHSHLWRNLGIIAGYIVFFTITYMLSAEYLSLSPSKGEVLLFLRPGTLLGALGRRSGHDEESGPAGGLPRASQPSDHKEPTHHVPAEGKPHGRIFHWSNVCYDISIAGERRRILDNVDGWVRPGTLTALMGATGAGKTTLLNVLADRVTMGVISGDMAVNGVLRGRAFQRQTGYVQQEDLHLETSTVREALRFSAVLRQTATVTIQQKHAYVEEVIDILEMRAYADALIGVPGVGLNVEQRKRLTIGVELAAKPDLLLFLDEPTSGLDSQTAWSIVSLMKKLSQNGQAILCTIHQPSAMLFQEFDRLLLLAKGGKTIYFGDIGENSRILTSYFEEKGADPCGPRENPAEWMLEVIGAAPGAHAKHNWPEVWRASPEYAAVGRELEALSRHASEPAAHESGPGEEDTSYAVPFHLQLRMVTTRTFQQYWRTPSYIYSKLGLCGITSLFIGVSFYKADLSEAGLQHQMFSVFMLLVIFAFLVYQTLPLFILQRLQYEGREREARVYSWYVFILANVVVEAAWSTLASLFVFFPFYYLIGMFRNGIPTHAATQRNGLWFFIAWSFMMFECTFTDMIAAGATTSEVGAVVALLLFALSLIFCGVMVPLSSLPGFWHFMYRVSPFTYIIGSMLSTGLANHDVECSSLELLQFNPTGNQTCGDYMAPYQLLAGGTVMNPDATSACQFCTLARTDDYLATINITFDHRWRDLGILWGYIVFNLFAIFFVYWLLRMPKRGGMWARLSGLLAKAS